VKRKRSARCRQRSVSNRVCGSTSDSSSEDEQMGIEKGVEAFDRRKKRKASKGEKRDGWRSGLSYREEAWRGNGDTLLHSSSDTSDDEEDSRRGRRDKDEREREKYPVRSRRREASSANSCRPGVVRVVLCRPLSGSSTSRCHPGSSGDVQRHPVSYIRLNLGDRSSIECRQALKAIVGLVMLKANCG